MNNFRLQTKKKAKKISITKPLLIKALHNINAQLQFKKGDSVT